jgi:hypothetical protein
MPITVTCMSMNVFPEVNIGAEIEINTPKRSITVGCMCDLYFVP